MMSLPHVGLPHGTASGLGPRPQALASAFSPSAFSPSAFPPSAFSPSAFLPLAEALPADPSFLG
eukprot:CAMPEP_0179075092 /NCGR_PEP_ID=MMETSP0796-20121207/33417_1 /TAXON_ID=73915 /ORGANISM="Pyrodinium bahamense, Strain pbaha01" /LENGTH=63 /DNA_ID=CAMNT_0020772323 /DNA_START=7 /DNA_END=195 /DNA_ORIENTATION=-